MRCFAGCGAILPDNSFTHKGHVISRYDGGTTSQDNIRLICETCNLQMETDNMYAWMKKFRRKPPYRDKGYSEYRVSKKDMPKLTKFEKREIRDKITNRILGKLPVVGIISACTGAGKTAMCVEGIGRHLRGKILIWVTEYTRIVESQFTPYNIASWKHAGFIPENTAVIGKRALKYCAGFPGTCIIYTTIDTAVKYYRKVCYDRRFLGFVIDESHHISGEETFKMLAEMKSRESCKIALGLSATHLDTEKTRQLFGEDPFLVDYTLLEGWRDGVIREIKIQCCMLKKKAEGREKEESLFGQIENPEVMVQNLKKVVRASETRKGVLWCERIEDANRWYRLIKTEMKKDEEFSEMEVMMDHTRMSEKKATDKQVRFAKLRENGIMVTAQKYSEGVDIKRLDFAGVVSVNANTSERLYLQRVGRLLRNEGREGPAVFCNFAVVGGLSEYVDQMRELFIDYYHGVKKKVVAVEGEERERIYFSSGSNSIECVSLNNEKKEARVMFEFLDDLHVVEIFEKRDAEFVAEMLYNTGRGISFDEIKKVLRESGITDPAEAQKFFNKCGPEMHPKIGKWWDIAKYLPMDYTKLLDLDNSGCYPTIQEAKKALMKVETLMTVEQIKMIHWNDRYQAAIKIDGKLPKDWRGMYKIDDPKEYWDPDIEKILMNL